MIAGGGSARLSIVNSGIAFTAVCLFVGAVTLINRSGQKPLTVATLAVAQVAAVSGLQTPYPGGGRGTGRILDFKIGHTRMVDGRALVASATLHRPAALRTARQILAVPPIGIAFFLAWTAVYGRRRQGGAERHIGGPRLVNLAPLLGRWARAAWASVRQTIGFPERRLFLGSVALSPADEVQHVLAVKSRLVINALLKQFGLFLPPDFQRLNG